MCLYAYSVEIDGHILYICVINIIIIHRKPQTNGRIMRLLNESVKNVFRKIRK